MRHVGRSQLWWQQSARGLGAERGAASGLHGLRLCGHPSDWPGALRLKMTLNDLCNLMVTYVNLCYFFSLNVLLLLALIYMLMPYC